jgi:hypothetical protein
MRRALVALALTLAVLGTGCAAASSSSKKFSGEQGKVADKVEKLQSAGESRDAKAICDDVLAKDLRDQIAAPGSTCENEVDKAIKDADDFKLEVEAVKISGGTATAQVKGRDRGSQRIRTFTFVREGSDWRATDLGS